MGYIFPSKKDIPPWLFENGNHNGHCPACKKELTEDDKLDWRIIDSDYNKFTIGEFHYWIAGFMVASSAWLWLTIVLLFTGLLSLP